LEKQTEQQAANTYTPPNFQITPVGFEWKSTQKPILPPLLVRESGSGYLRDNSSF